ncbi:hypothetical protein [Cereibacter sphaeroides]|uniref:hypothetical protein n=1 Tax=Cereibacter sphaeroides TaxID=1063 RepID=UPI001375D2E4|nr:hypothetical protein [Cereibacter sphaeroides]
MSMTRTYILNPNPPEFERFLYASVGKDQEGGAVTVLSALARLNLDPWVEAADLANLSRERAATRLGLLLGRGLHGTAPGQDHGALGWELTRLLPEGAGTIVKAGPVSSGAFWVILGAIVILVLMILGGWWGSAT